MATQDSRRETVRRMQAHIEEHLGDPVTLATLARHAGCSPWHASRLFREEVGMSPFTYLRLRRLSAAARHLGSTRDKVVDVAFDFVFDSHEGFTRAFTRHFGLSPRQYRRDRPPVAVFMPERMRGVYEFTSQGGRAMEETRRDRTVFVQVVERPARRLVLKRGREATHYFQYCDEVGCGVWEQLGAVPDALHEPMGLWLPEAMRLPGTSAYVQGVEVDRDFAGPIPADFEIIDLPACLWMVFQGPPFADEEYAEAIHSLEAAIRAYRPEAFGFAWDDESGPRFQLEPRGDRGYIEGRPVRRLEEQAGGGSGTPQQGGGGHPENVRPLHRA